MFYGAWPWTDCRRWRLLAGVFSQLDTGTGYEGRLLLTLRVESRRRLIMQVKPLRAFSRDLGPVLVGSPNGFRLYN